MADGLYTTPTTIWSIDDNATSNSKTWSSSKIDTELNQKVIKPISSIPENIIEFWPNGVIKDSGKKVEDFSEVWHNHNAGNIPIDTSNFWNLLSTDINNVQILADVIDDGILAPQEVISVTGEIISSAGQTVFSDGIDFDLPDSKDGFFVVLNNIFADLSLYERTGVREITFNTPLPENTKIRVWRGAPSVTSPSGWDMSKSTYDPTNVNWDAFDMDNMTEGASNKFFSSLEKAKLSDTPSFVFLTQAAYDALATPTSGVVYMING